MKYCSSVNIVVNPPWNELKIPIQTQNIIQITLCCKCALQNIRIGYIIERAATCGHNSARYQYYLSYTTCVSKRQYNSAVEGKTGKLCGLTMKNEEW